MPQYHTPFSGADRLTSVTRRLAAFLSSRRMLNTSQKHGRVAHLCMVSSSIRYRLVRPTGRPSVPLHPSSLLCDGSEHHDLDTPPHAPGVVDKTRDPIVSAKAAWAV